MIQKEEAMCLWCGRFVEIKKNGNLKSHKSAGNIKCEGSDKPYELKMNKDKNKASR